MSATAPAGDGAAHGIPAHRVAAHGIPAPSTVRRTPTLLIVAHGTRDPEGVAATEALVARVRELRPELSVACCYLDLVSPSLPEALARLHGPVVLVPLLLGAGYHVRVDIPDAVAAAPSLGAVHVADALGPHPLLVDALTDRLAEAGWRSGHGPVVLAAAGSTDPDANADADAMAALLGERHPCTTVVPSYLCAAGPTPAEAVSALRAAGHDRVAVAEYLLSPGFFARKAARSGAWTTSAPLGPHDAIAQLVTLRYDEALRRATTRGRAGGVREHIRGARSHPGTEGRTTAPFTHGA
ncbi:sirohydrochlorin chelatase [Streptacidiphilus fuscans]|uniref:Sirohydrochlorin chelatase n=1 Tax=Streptacidiphilus fuscans TaxID=2789292 RepID=A0A931FHV9_9ACTN|nr:sirohydrochlorin chelatase [Streptacidiphilus fuscans]MBF9071104.1 sirohydrochlorin chelatase [Streptacidiphilus fuscans]